MRIPIGYKFIIGFVVVVAAVAFSPKLVSLLGYSPEISILLGYLVALTIGLILGWLFSKGFTANIGRLTDSAESISRGDLTRGVTIRPSRFPDESHELADLINLMLLNLRELVGHIQKTSTLLSGSAREINSTALEINASTEEVAQAIEQISRGAEIQAGLVEKGSQTIREIAVSIELVSSRARETAKTARETCLTAQHGGSVANDSLERMKDFFKKQEQLGNQFETFNRKLQKVGKVADCIGDIAHQTNLLALNASIEAARAGEYGKGFSVVAEEVRKLADSSSQSAADISDMIENLRDESHQVHELMVESSSSIQEGKKNIDITSAAFQEILKTVLDTERKASSIADLSQMQKEGSARMVAAIDEIAKVADDNAASTEQVSAATEEQLAAMQDMALATKELAQLAEELMTVVERFEIERS
ncbi:MAG: methyl-accepting chemotaxis protein [Desulfuromonadaceae bacterium]|nr:methyl-accepting chemotaxis protein [Desulfuromonadaceae bacterium]MDD5106516.1 methyl-accepting chemotaxis protein [Desulfuromonadaceae bacterium]